MITSNLTDIGQSHRNVLDTIIRYSHLSGQCYAPNATIAKEVGLSISRVSHIISDLGKAEYVKVQLEYYPNSKQVMRRSIVVLSRDARGKANHSEEQSVYVNNNKNSDNIWADAFNEAVNYGVSALTLIKLATAYGKTVVAEKIAMLLNSKSVRNPIAWLVSACKNNWKSATHKTLKKVKHIAHVVIDMPKVSSHVDPNSDFLKVLSPSLRNQILACNA